MRPSCLVTLGVLSLLLGPAAAQTLTIGSKAPELQVSKWIKGEPFDLKSAKGSQITVLEFWATW